MSLHRLLPVLLAFTLVVPIHGQVRPQSHIDILLKDANKALDQGCNSFYVTLGQGSLISYALRNIDISFDHPKSRIALEIHQI